MSWRVVVASSCPSTPVSLRMVKIVAYFRVEADIILSTFAVVGMSGIFRSHLYFGLVHWMLLVWQNQLYTKQSFVLVALQTVELAI